MNFISELWKSIADYEFESMRMAWNGNTGFGALIARGTFQGYKYGYGKLDQSKKIEIQGVDVLILDDNGLVKEEIACYNMCDAIKQIQS